MKKLVNYKFDNINLGEVELRVYTRFPEKFINLLWKNNIRTSNIIRLDITTVSVTIALTDYARLEKLAKQCGIKIKVVRHSGLYYYIIRFRKHISLYVGALIFALVLLYFSTYIWSIDISTDQYVSPYEIRRSLYMNGIKPGIPKSKIHISDIEEKLLKENDGIMWIRIRIEGSKLKVVLAESHEPPTIDKAEEPCNIVAGIEGQVTDVYTEKGTALVKPGDVVKKGQLLIKGEQGKEGNTYEVRAAGKVEAKTFYEYNDRAVYKGVKEVHTGNRIVNKYISLFGKKIYIKKSLNKFTSYDKIEESNGILHKEIIRELKKKAFQIEEQKLIDKFEKKYYNKTLENIDRDAAIVDKKIDTHTDGNTLRVRILFVVQQNIGVEQFLQDTY
ncbi:sporulation protein YqfD [Clostridium oryzae]|uniref:Putative stage IV sporulation protein YqfD n=1 Tax=Clostridium oryzae TaxID=1450648 RepID=A0A1V4IVN7_9CLOT|nr:sporulation protein YqfD [Clostridium oryzae]OPJ63855.1 putative stage IV sporulation protein YqfD [Clostridium oryzae]